jgi:hypothetical protein
VVCPLPFYTSQTGAHVLTKAKWFHGQGMLHGILGDDSDGFVHGIAVPMSIELTLFCSSVGVILYVLLLQGFH